MSTIDQAGHPVEEEGAAAEEAAAPPPSADVQRLMALSAVQHGVKTLVEEERARLTAAAVDVWRKTKVTTTSRHPLGRVSLREHHDQVAVVDDEALLDFVLKHAEDEVEVITTCRVRPAYVTALLRNLVIVDDHIVDKETGSVVELPGVSILRGGEPDSISVTLTPETKATAEAMARGRADQLASYTLPAAPEGGDGS